PRPRGQQPGSLDAVEGEVKPAAIWLAQVERDLPAQQALTQGASNVDETHVMRRQADFAANAIDPGGRAPAQVAHLDAPGPVPCGARSRPFARNVTVRSQRPSSCPS